MIVRDFMSRRPITLTPDTEILKALSLMETRDIANAPVVDDEGRLVGIFSDRDCIRGVLHGAYHDEFAGLVGEFMSSDPQTMSPDDGLMDAARRIAELPYRLYPVMEDGTLVGVISRRDVVSALTRSSQWFKRSA